MAFMEPEVIRGYGYIVETNDGSSFVVPAAILEGKPTAHNLMQYAPENVGRRHQSHEKVKGFFAHLTAPGYLDQTDWEFLETQAEVDAWIEAEEEGDEDDDEYDDDDDDDDERDPYHGRDWSGHPVE